MFLISVKGDDDSQDDPPVNFERSKSPKTDRVSVKPNRNLFNWDEKSPGKEDERLRNMSQVDEDMEQVTENQSTHHGGKSNIGYYH